MKSLGLPILMLCALSTACGDYKAKEGPPGPQGEMGSCTCPDEEEAPVPSHPLDEVNVCVWDGDKWMDMSGTSKIYEELFSEWAVLGKCADHPGLTDIN